MVIQRPKTLPLPVEWWYHLYNDEDAVFTAPIRLPSAQNFTQVETHFDIDGLADHDATEYLSHLSARNAVCPIAIAQSTLGAGRSISANTRRIQAAPTARTKTQQRRRALLVGITSTGPGRTTLWLCERRFPVSSLFKSLFTAEDIRIVLDDRATAAGIQERLEWPRRRPSSHGRIGLYYSGHGAQIPPRIRDR